MSWRRAESLDNYIKRKHKSKSEFARFIGVDRQQVTKWANDSHFVIRGRLYSLRRRIDRAAPPAPDTAMAEADLLDRKIIERGGS